MAKIECFEDIGAWQDARKLTRLIYQTTTAGKFARDFGLRDQIQRAAVSMMSNIAEGFERSGNKEFGQFLATAKGSSGEVRSLLYVALDANYITQEQFDNLSVQARQINRQLAGFIKYLQASTLRGSKFKSSGQQS